METLCVGQATRYRWPIAADVIAGVRRVEEQLGKLKRFILILGAQLALAAFSYSSAVLLLAESRGTIWALEVLRHTLGIAICCRLGGSLSLGLYRRSLRHASLPDLLAVAQAVVLSDLFLGLLMFSQFSRVRMPATAFLLDAALLQLLWSGFHFGARVVCTHQPTGRHCGKRTLIVGAGDAGLAILKELALNAAVLGRPVALIDDDPRKWGCVFFNVPVKGGTKDLAKIALQTKAEQIVICVPSATRPQMRRILDVSRRTRLPIRSLPSITELIRGVANTSVPQRGLRSPLLEDLLQREEVRVDPQETCQIVGGKVVLVTGAGGCIGTELCRQIALAGPQKLLLLDKSENSLFYLNLEISERLGSARVKPYLADLLDKHRLRKILLEERPEIVFHAAAHKHVAMLELHPQEAIRNNVLGTRNIAQASLESGVRRFVNISTDKAVEPCNYMGLSKQLTELCIQDMARGTAAGIVGTRFSNVRFGNVAGTTGSVLRLFWDQIQKGGPVRVTDPRATRYFMSVPEAVQLILRAAALGRGGETFVLDMGAPLNIYELAKTMMLFAGLQPETDIPIEFTGLQRGEKIDEKLWGQSEEPTLTGCTRILAVREKGARSEGVLGKIRVMEEFLQLGDSEGLVGYLQELFPDFGARNASAFQHRTRIESDPTTTAVGAA
jgi:FlaA1/EpsC-like NDP-sugar epimerase